MLKRISSLMIRFCLRRVLSLLNLILALAGADFHFDGVPNNYRYNKFLSNLAKRKQ
jgi:hypothetical protein